MLCHTTTADQLDQDAAYIWENLDALVLEDQDTIVDRKS